ncbi:hypothetical protein N7457_006442 [Penicillium paradoxum]|uniref:uncharacterized protein n=1 Tax=Penicillium paradoxum TaxID=176176 RepID=UPI002549A992|nr:uncharacterized protein N7457_006442 [Penicillium paradoxum]KAJ5781282.1 hypothetical protein N7457_006442 [Penicillium paradoxum]
MPKSLRVGPGLEAEYTEILGIVETQIEILRSTERRRHEVIETLEKLCRDLVAHAALEDFRPRSHLIGYAHFRLFCLTLRHWLPEAIMILESYGTSHQVDNERFRWVSEGEIKYRAKTLLDAQSTEWYS